jgi:hypothetical protein
MRQPGRAAPGARSAYHRRVNPPPSTLLRPRWQRVAWGVAGLATLATGVVGIFVPLLPTTPLVLLAAFCFSRGSPRLERWLLEHRRFGPMIIGWRTHRAIPLRAKQTAWVMMALGSAWAAWVLPAPWAALPALCCAAVSFWMWRLPSRPVRTAGSASGPASRRDTPI